MGTPTRDTTPKPDPVTPKPADPAQTTLSAQPLGGFRLSSLRALDTTDARGALSVCRVKIVVTSLGVRGQFVTEGCDGGRRLTRLGGGSDRADRHSCETHTHEHQAQTDHASSFDGRRMLPEQPGSAGYTGTAGEFVWRCDESAPFGGL